MTAKECKRVIGDGKRRATRSDLESREVREHPTPSGRSLGTMDIFKPHCGDCSNGGISYQYDEVLVWSEKDDGAPGNAVLIIEDVCCGEPRIRAIPARGCGEAASFGGCILYTSNGVVPHSGTPIKLFDRFE